MKRTKRAALFLLCAALAAAPVAATAPAEADVRSAKALFFDKRYPEARAIWEPLAAGRGPEAEAAAYWVARCSEGAGEHERAFREYTSFLTRRPADSTLVEEARTARVSLAARLFRGGRANYLNPLREALGDRNRTVRYFAALQVAGLGGEAAALAVPVLREIVASERDPDLVDRARLHLLRLDPASLAGGGGGAAPPAPRAGRAEWVKVRIFERGQSQPKLSLNVPFALADLLFKALPDDVRRELRAEGYDADSLWDKLRALPPTRILEVEGEGDRVQIWIE